MSKTSNKPMARKKRLWVPGAAYLDDERILRMGDEVGYNGWGEDFRLAQCHFASLRSLNHRVWLLERSHLSAELIDELAIIMPHTLVDAEQQPHARRWLEGQPLVCVSGIKWEALIDKGLRVFCVEHGVEAANMLRVQAAGGELPSWSLRLELDNFDETVVRLLGGQPSVMAESLTARNALDGVLRQLSRGVLSESGVLNALTARRLVEPGYGYHGATDGRAASMEHIAHSLIGIEALFRQVHQHADEQRLIVRDMRDALRGLTEDDAQIQVPLYGSARQQRLHALELPLEDDPKCAPSWQLGGEPQRALLLRERFVYSVERAKLWSPKLSADERARLQAERHLKSPPPAWLTPLLVAILLLFIAIALWQLQSS